jgi:DNA-binding NarL/FixJ family response regulator
VFGQAEPPTRTGAIIDLRPSSRGTGERTIRVLVAHGSRLVAEALMFTFGTNAALEPVGYALDGWEAVELTTALEPDAVVVGAELGGLDSPSFTRLAHLVWPRMQIILFAGEKDDPNAQGAYAFGAANYLPAERSVDELMNALEAAWAHQAAFERIGADAMVQTGMGA